MRWASNGARHVQSGLFLLVELQSGAPYAPKQLFQLGLPQVRLRCFATCPVFPVLLHRVAWRQSATPTVLLPLARDKSSPWRCPSLLQGLQPHTPFSPQLSACWPQHRFLPVPCFWKYNLILVWQNGLTKPTGLKSQHEESRQRKHSTTIDKI